MVAITPAQRAALHSLVNAMADPTQQVRVAILCDAVPYPTYQAIMALPPELLDRWEAYETIGKVIAVRPTVEGLRLATEATPDA